MGLGLYKSTKEPHCQGINHKCSRADIISKWHTTMLTLHCWRDADCRDIGTVRGREGKVRVFMRRKTAWAPFDKKLLWRRSPFQGKAGGSSISWPKVCRTFFLWWREWIFRFCESPRFPRNWANLFWFLPSSRPQRFKRIYFNWFQNKQSILIPETGFWKNRGRANSGQTYK